MSQISRRKEEEELSEKKIEEKKLQTKLKKLQTRYMYWYCWGNQPKGKMGRKVSFKDTRSIVFIVNITLTRPHQNRRPVGTVRPVQGQMVKYTPFVHLVLVESIFRCTQSMVYHKSDVTLLRVNNFQEFICRQIIIFVLSAASCA